jgi:hypothetical protein
MGLGLLLLAVACGEGGTQTVTPNLVPPPDRYDFGEAPVLNERKLELPLDNPGRAGLNIMSIRVKEEGSVFRIGEYPAEVERGGKVVVDLFFRPLEEKAYEGTLVLETDDPTSPLMELPMTGVGSKRAVMELEPASLDFGRTPEGGATVQTLTIRSIGSADLIVEELAFTGDSSPGFTFIGSTRTPATVKTVDDDGLPGELKVTVKYAVVPGDPAQATGGLRIRNTDPDQPEVIVPLNGQVNRAPLPVIAGVANAAPGMVVPLDGSGSSDPDNDTPLTYKWTLTRRPSGAIADLGDETAAVTDLTLDPLLPGEYEVSLVVTDSLGAKSVQPAKLRIVAVPAQKLLVELFWNNSLTDVDLHLLMTPQSRLKSSDDCYYGNCVPGRGIRDWGQLGVTEDNPVLLRDALTGYGPEVIGITEPVAGTYRVVAHFEHAHEAPKPQSEVTVRVYSYGRVVHESKRILETAGTSWPVVDVAWPSGEATPVEQ